MKLIGYFITCGLEFIYIEKIIEIFHIIIEYTVTVSKTLEDHDHRELARSIPLAVQKTFNVSVVWSNISCWQY